MRIAIAGTGRSGTSLLVRLFDAWGFRTVDGPWHDDAAAGLEARLGSRPDLEVEKDPWAFEYVARLDLETLQGYDAFIVPVRSRKDASISRVVRDRVQRALRSPGDEWQWDTWGVHAGGTVVETTAEAVGNALGKGLWDLLDTVSAAGIQPTILQFPRFALDFDYLWSQLKSVAETRIEEDLARQAWERVVDPTKIRIDASDSADPRLAELGAVIEALRTEARRARAAVRSAEATLTATRQSHDVELASLRDQLEQRDASLSLLREELLELSGNLRRESAAAREARATTAAMKSSTSWRLTRPLRGLRDAIRR